MSSPDWQTAQWLSNSLGRSMVERTKEGLSFGAHEIRDGVSLSSHEEITPLVLPSELQVLPNLHDFIKMPRDLPVAHIILEPKTRPPMQDTIIRRKQKKPAKQPASASAKIDKPAAQVDWTGENPSGPPAYITDVPPPQAPPPGHSSSQPPKQPPRQYDPPLGARTFTPPGQTPTEARKVHMSHAPPARANKAQSPNLQIPAPDQHKDRF